MVDLDDTLCNTWDAGKGTMFRVVLHLFGKGKFRMVYYLLTGGYRELERSEVYHRMDLGDLIEAVFGRVYSKVSQKDIDDVLKLVEEEFFSRLRLYPDALPFLRGLKDLGAKVVLVTDSSSRWQRKKVEYLRIGEFLDDIIISGETGHSKLGPYNFRLAASRFREREIYVVGDRDETDMAGAKAVGGIGILVRRGYFRNRKAKNADYVVDDLMGALEVITREHELKAGATP
ncbi:HAD family hydrolase [Thermococcus sp. Bubb.Bath]|uniref:HAD family hydrolase n=1 Tax=Thermococcus sp. Bubb.Bath TaxID=1638242 RepID=UPI003183A404